MVFSYLHFQVGTWKVIFKWFHAVSTFVLWTLRLDNADAGENVTENWRPFKPFLDYSNLFIQLKKEYRFLSLERYSKMYRLLKKT